MHARSWAELPKRTSPASYAETAEAISAESSLSAEGTACGTSGRPRPTPFEHLNDDQVSSLPGARKAHPETEGSDALESNQLPVNDSVVDMHVETRCPLKIRGETFLEAPRAQPESRLGQSGPQSRRSTAAIVLAALEIVSELERASASGPNMNDETYPFAISPTTSEFEREMMAAFELPRSPSSDTDGHSSHATSPFPNACES
jgi:hypothetical protein